MRIQFTMVIYHRYINIHTFFTLFYFTQSIDTWKETYLNFTLSWNFLYWQKPDTPEITLTDLETPFYTSEAAGTLRKIYTIIDTFDIADNHFTTNSQNTYYHHIGGSQYCSFLTEASLNLNVLFRCTKPSCAVVDRTSTCYLADNYFKPLTRALKIIPDQGRTRF